MIGKLFRQVANTFLNPSGYEIIPRYKVDHLKFKQKQIVQEVENFYFTNILKNVPKNKNRTNLLSELYGTEILEALHIIYYLNKTKKLKGDICEFGIANGATSSLIANEILKTKDNLWLYDSFEGLSKPTKKDILINDIFNYGRMDRYFHSMKYAISDVKNRLHSIPFPEERLRIIPGFIEKTANNNDNFPQKIRFAYLDFDLYKPTIIALQALKEKMVKSGIIIVDDYNFFSKGVKTAIDEFCRKSKNYKKIMPLEKSGNFIILKRIK